MAGFPAEKYMDCIAGKRLMKNSRGLTLFELIIVISIIAILAALAVPAYINIAEDAAEAQFKMVMQSFKSSTNQMNAFWVVKGKPVSITVSSNIDINMTTAGWPWYTANNNHVPLPYSAYNGRYSIQLWYALLTPAPYCIGPVTPPASGWYGSTVDGSGRVLYYFFTATSTWAFRYDRNSGAIIQTM
jgi:MSHA pilin protein MshB